MPTNTEITVEIKAVNTLNINGSSTDLENKVSTSTGLEKIFNTSATSGKMINKANTVKLIPSESLNPAAM
jgi:hypothetical protein